jgi:alpha-soluble NSF attachment protein
VHSIEENSAEEFTKALKEYDTISRLSNWCTTLLLRVKKSLDDEPDLT